MKSATYILYHPGNFFWKFIFLFTFLIVSCIGKSGSESGKILKAGTGYITRAERIKIDKLSGSVTVTILNPWQGANNVNLIYHLVRRGSAIPAGMDSSTIIFVPVKKIICMSTTHVAMISALNEENTISGVSGTSYVFSEKIIKNIGKGLVEDVGYEANLNKELILKISPDLVMMYGIGSESAGYTGKIRELGVKVIFNADYLETDPLGKAEWIKLFGALYCNENLADSIYTSEFQEYNTLKSFIEQHISARPKVLLGLPYKDTWFISPGNSFISKLIGDAGGDYLWHNTESSVSMPFGIEKVYLGALTAEYWLNIGSVSSKNDIISVDQRLKDLPCYKNGNLYNNNKRVTIKGGNDFWESGAVYPHLILKDIATILHPELFNDKELVFYRKIF
jgi:iron complex transport system substrate-binding protein